MCNNCIHKPICSKFKATGGHMSQCDHHRKERIGVWADRYGGKYANKLYECSECKKIAPYKVEVDVLGHEQIVQSMSDYCPNCGADMRGEKDA